MSTAEEITEAVEFYTAPDAVAVVAARAAPATRATPAVNMSPEVAGNPGIVSLCAWTSAVLNRTPGDDQLMLARSDPRNIVAFRLDSDVLVRVDRLDDGQLARAEAGPPDMANLITYDVGDPPWGEAERSSGRLVIQRRDRSGYWETRTIFPDGVQHVESYRLDEVTLPRSLAATGALWRGGADLAQCAEMARVYRGHVHIFAVGETLVRLDRLGADQIIRYAVGRDGVTDQRAYRVGDPPWRGGLAIGRSDGVSWVQVRNVGGVDHTRTILPDGSVDFRGGHDENEVYESADSQRRRDECVTRAGPKQLWKVADRIAGRANAKNAPKNLPTIVADATRLLRAMSETGKMLRPFVAWGKRGRVPTQVRSAAQDAVAHLHDKADICLGGLRRFSLYANKPMVSARDVFAQLRLLEREYGGVYHDPAKKRIVVVIGPIVLVDPVYTDIGCDFGHFALALDYDNFGDKNIDAGSFSAHPVLGNVGPLNGGGYSLPHPHISDTAICMGSATAPVNRALEELRIFDAFLLVATMLGAMGENCTPYTPVWRYVYRKRQMREMGHDVDNFTDDVDEEDDDEFEGGLEDEPEEEPEEDTRRRCDGCGQRYDLEGGSTCDHCDHDYCDGCLHDCECGNSICNDCKRTCVNCHDTCCNCCASQCASCAGYMCEDCVDSCEGCSQKTCNNCGHFCAECDSFYCDACGEDDDHMVACKSCGTKNCREVIGRCASCRESSCPSCLVTPEWSVHACCPGCVATCDGCGRSFGAYELHAGRCPACARPNLMGRFLDEERQYRARRAARLEADRGHDRDRAAAVADGGGGDPGHVRDHADVRQGGAPRRAGGDDDPAEAAGVVGGCGAGVSDEEAGRPGPAPEYAEREPFRLVVDGVVIERNVYPGLPLFNAICWAEHA